MNWEWRNWRISFRTAVCLFRHVQKVYESPQSHFQTIFSGSSQSFSYYCLRSPGRFSNLEDGVDFRYPKASEEKFGDTSLHENGISSHDLSDENDFSSSEDEEGCQNGVNSHDPSAENSQSQIAHHDFLRNVPSTANNHSLIQKPFRCLLCDDLFETLKLHERHKWTHTTRSLSCTECGKSFHSRSNLNEHLDIHRGPKHKCSQCNKEFVQRSNLKTHMRSCKTTDFTKNAKTSNEDDDRTVCYYCPKSFKNTRDMYRHARNNHPEHEMSKIPCKLCSKTYYSEPALTAHMRKFHRSEIKDLPGKQTEWFYQNKPCSRLIWIIRPLVKRCMRWRNLK